MVGFGFLVTVIMQSSSASMTTTLAAVASGAIGLEQAAALAIGQNIGTTPTAVIAALGGPAATKRTAATHVLFNVLTGIVAVVILPWLLRVCQGLAQWAGSHDAPTVLALFHTVFNVLGVVLLLPVVGPFARLLERVFPERGTRAMRYLTPSVAHVGPVALEAARRALLDILGDTAGLARAAVGRGPQRPADAATLPEVTAGLQSVLRFVHTLGLQAQAATELVREQNLVHATDHLDRAADGLRRLPELTPDSGVFEADPILAQACAPVADIAGQLAAQRGEVAAAGFATHGVALVEQAQRVSADLAELRRQQRRETLRLAALGRLDPDVAMRRVDLLLWLDSLAYHLWRAAYHLQPEPAPVAAGAAGTAPEAGLPTPAAE
jgi:phosphate:Na+ symporter